MRNSVLLVLASVLLSSCGGGGGGASSGTDWLTPGFKTEYVHTDVVTDTSTVPATITEVVSSAQRVATSNTVTLPTGDTAQVLQGVIIDPTWGPSYWAEYILTTGPDAGQYGGGGDGDMFDTLQWAATTQHEPDPLSVSATWTEKYAEVINDNYGIWDNCTFADTYSVLAVEPVTVPAGAFDAYRVEVPDSPGDCASAAPNVTPARTEWRVPGLWTVRSFEHQTLSPTQTEDQTLELAASGMSDDTDADGIPDVTDNCAFLANAGQADTDGDGLGDSCDLSPSTGPRIVKVSPGGLQKADTQSRLAPLLHRF